MKEKSIEGSNAKFTWGVKNGTELQRIVPGFSVQQEVSLVEGMKELMPVYCVIGKIPAVRNISNKIIVWRNVTDIKEMMQMQKRHFEMETDGFYGAYWKCKTDSDCAMIAMIGDDSEDYLARTSVKWLHKLGVNVMTMSPAKRIMDIIIIRWNV